MIKSNIIGIIADDLTGANDTALQFFTKGASTEIILDYKDFPACGMHTDVWAISTETRNIEGCEAGLITFEACLAFKNNLKIEYFYKKIDSTLRGNIAFEILSALEACDFNCAIIAPAFIQEGRVTVGGYQLVKGIPIERTEAARDPHCPIYESNIVNILKKQLEYTKQYTVGLIDFSTVAKGAGPITMKLNELIKEGKKLIVVDALSIVDMEQIALAMRKSSYRVLPCGSAGFAQVLADDWLEGVRPQHIKKTIPSLPKLVLSGSATQTSNLQINKLRYDEDITNTYFINLKTQDILKGVDENILERIISNLVKNNIVTVGLEELTHELEKENSEARDLLIDEGITQEEFAHKITNYLAQLAYEVKEKKDFVLITIGGETSFKCIKKLGCEHLQVVDEILPAIPLCLSSTGQLVVTKSGNLGNYTTLIEIMKYFKHHEE